MSSIDPNLPTNPSRIRAFASFFRSYMATSTLVVAALPIPVTSLHLIRTYNFQTKVLSVYTPLFCFLVLALIFFARHSLARLMFRIVPDDEKGSVGYEAGNPAAILIVFLLIAGSFLCTIWYQVLLSSTAINMQTNDLHYASLDEALQKADPLEVGNDYQAGLLILYLGIFVCAEAAFVMMAIKEYLQDYLKIPDVDLLTLRFEDREAEAKPLPIDEPEE